MEERIYSGDRIFISHVDGRDRGGVIGRSAQTCCNFWAEHCDVSEQDKTRQNSAAGALTLASPAPVACDVGEGSRDSMYRIGEIVHAVEQSRAKWRSALDEPFLAKNTEGLGWFAWQHRGTTSFARHRDAGRPPQASPTRRCVVSLRQEPAQWRGTALSATSRSSSDQRERCEQRASG
jgi:hypothetical protein